MEYTAVQVELREAGGQRRQSKVQPSQRSVAIRLTLRYPYTIIPPANDTLEHATMTRTILLILSATLLASPLAATVRQKPVVKPADYGQWESLGQPTLSPDGKWLAYPIRRVNEEDELRIRSLTRDTTRVGNLPQFCRHFHLTMRRCRWHAQGREKFGSTALSSR